MVIFFSSIFESLPDRRQEAVVGFDGEAPPQRLKRILVPRIAERLDGCAADVKHRIFHQPGDMFELVVVRPVPREQRDREYPHVARPAPSRVRLDRIADPRDRGIGRQPPERRSAHGVVVGFAPESLETDPEAAGRIGLHQRPDGAGRDRVTRIHVKGVADRFDDELAAEISEGPDHRAPDARVPVSVCRHKLPADLDFRVGQREGGFVPHAPESVVKQGLQKGRPDRRRIHHPS